jgi:hypothetical protein
MTASDQRRNAPAPFHRQLKASAARAGVSLADYLGGEIRPHAERPTIEQLRARLRERAPVASSLTPAQAIRDERDGLA